MFNVRQQTAALLNVFFPPACISCHTRLTDQKVWLCGSCFEKLSPMPEQRCPKCGYQTEGTECSNCAENHYVFTQAVAVFLYEGPAKAMVHALKYRGLYAIADWFANRMYMVLQNEPKLMETECVAAIPLHGVRKRVRGYNQSAKIAEALAGKMGKPYLDQALVRKVNTETQTHLSAAARRNNLQDAFKAGRDDVSGKKVLLIDDVFTTGTTVNEASKVMLKAGAVEVYIMTACHGL